jgi:hypothetical protein
VAARAPRDAKAGVVLLLDKTLQRGADESWASARAQRRRKKRGSGQRTCAWYSMLGSCRLLRQIAHVSVSTFHDHTATAFHFLTRNLHAPFARSRF